MGKYFRMLEQCQAAAAARAMQLDSQGGDPARIGALLECAEHCRSAWKALLRGCMVWA